MRIAVEFTGRIRRAAGVARRELECAPHVHVSDVIVQIAADSDAELAGILLDESGRPRASLVVAVNGEHLVGGEPRMLADGDEVLLLSPVAGG